MKILSVDIVNIYLLVWLLIFIKNNMFNKVRFNHYFNKNMDLVDDLSLYSIKLLF